jgi:hypothetical protein
MHSKIITYAVRGSVSNSSVTQGRPSRQSLLDSGQITRPWSNCETLSHDLYPGVAGICRDHDAEIALAEAFVDVLAPVSALIETRSQNRSSKPGSPYE